MKLRNSYLVVLFLLLYVWSQAQSNIFSRISTDDGMGLASNEVQSLYQDEKGFIWLGTANGLQRFDGTKFISFVLPIGRGDELPMSGLSQILPAGRNQVWLFFYGLREVGLFNTSTLEYKRIPIKPSRQLPARAEFRMWVDSKGRAFLCILRYGILQYDARENAFTENCIIKLPKGWTPSLVIFEDVVKRQYWIPSYYNGLCVYDEKSGETWHKDYNPQQIPIFNNIRVNQATTEFYIDSKRRHWIFNWPVYGGGPQLKHCLDSTGAQFLQSDTMGIGSSISDTLSTYNEFRHFYESRNGTLWFYGLNVLMNFDSAQKRFVYNRNRFIDNYGIRYENVFQVMEDRDGVTWIATDQGLYYNRTAGSKIVTAFARTRNMIPVTINDVIELEDGKFWLATWGHGIYELDRNLKPQMCPVYDNMPIFPPAVRRSFELTWTLHQQKSNNHIWIGCQSGQLIVFDPQSRQSRFITDSIFRGTIRSITEDRIGNIWIGNQSGQLIKWDGKKFTQVYDAGTIIYKVFIDADGWIWLATHSYGLIAINPASGKIIQQYKEGRTEKDIFNSQVSDIEQFNDSIIYCSADALNIVNKRQQRVRQVTMREGLPSNSAKRLRIDQDGYLWIITKNGLCRYDQKKQRFTPYGKKDGMLNLEKTDDCDFIRKDGYLVFGGNDQLVMFHPSEFYANQPPPNVVITDFKLFNNFLPVDSLQTVGEARLKHYQNSISIYFSVLSYKQSDKLTYYYKLEGRDNEWQITDRNTAISYTQLPPGQYSFLVKCENREGIFSSGTTSFKIHITPPYWRTWWFLGLIAVLISGLAYLLHRLRINKILAIEAIRTRVARDLHDDMGSTLSTINILSTMAKSKLNTDTAKTSEYISKISENSQRMMEAMDDIVWSIKPANDSMQKIVARMREFVTSVMEAKDIEAGFKVEEPVYHIKLNMEARRDFFLVFKEAINNAAKYSKAEKVQVSLSTDNKNLYLKVEDDGIGFNVEEADNGNGLVNMQKRAEGLKGKISIVSAPGRGTKVLLSIPLNS